MSLRSGIKCAFPIRRPGPKAMFIWRGLTPDSKQRIDCCFGNRKTSPHWKELLVSGFGIIITSVDTLYFPTCRRFDISKRRARHPAEMLAQISPLSGSKNGGHNPPQSWAYSALCMNSGTPTQGPLRNYSFIALFNADTGLDEGFSQGLVAYCYSFFYIFITIISNSKNNKILFALQFIHDIRKHYSFCPI